MPVLITGATGFLGKNLLKRLLDDGEEVVALVRNPAALGVTHDRLSVIGGDFTDRAAVSDALGRVDRAYHVAAAVKEWVRDWTVFDRVNVDAWRAFLDIAADKGVSRIVYTSSFMALGNSDRVGVGDETLEHEPDHFHNPYERTKALAARITREYAARGAPVVTVMPGVIFGPGELTEGNLVVQMLIDMTRGKFPGIPGSGKQKWCYAFVEDVVEGHVLAMQKGRAGERYILGGENIDLDTFVDVAARLLERKVPRRHVPLGLLTASAHLMETWARIAGGTPMMTVGKAGVLRHHWAYSSEKAVAEIGYRVTSFEKALARTIAWMRASGLIAA
ncbi:NAD-dependent epimerase/dehydratase family protein [bacterium]|nr:NAD-dependent epimerase/dehydratase family protein [bacterium]